MALVKKFEAVKFEGSLKSNKVLSSIAVEASIALYVNGTRIAIIMATPDMIKELAIGYLICEGVISNLGEIEDIKIYEEKEKIEVYVKLKDDGNFQIWNELRSSGCIGVAWDQEGRVKVCSNLKLKVSVIQNSLKYLESDVYAETRGVHSASLIDESGKLIARAIDVGRHNAVDKVVGKALLEKVELSKLFLLSTGRQSAGMVMKAARAGIPMVVTKAAPLSSGVEAAEKTGICLIGLANKDNMVVYSHLNRVEKG
ncbi:MAG: formate dehydrogenase accessory sulfurtransferase FdhD [Methanocellales archaeon]